MLTDDFPQPDGLHLMLDAFMGNGMPPKRLDTGIYLRGGFGGSNYVPGWEEWPEFPDWRSPYGVCDNHQQVLNKYPELQDPDRVFMVYLTEVRREDQVPKGGWRWHKWGDYIGEHEPKCEYLYDEDPSIERVFCFHIYEKPA